MGRYVSWTILIKSNQKSEKGENRVSRRRSSAPNSIRESVILVFSLLDYEEKLLPKLRKLNLRKHKKH